MVNWAYFIFIFVVLLCPRIDARRKTKDCLLSSYGSEYTGDLTQTVTGKTCQAWSSQSPHSHTWTRADYFPDYFMEDTGRGGVSNKCRNPDAFHEGLWCYTDDPGTRWEMCEVPKCHAYAECKNSVQATGYRGSESTTRTGTPCIPWAEAEESYGLEDDSNWCRNPDNKPEGPWCYTSASEWEYCEVPFCKPSAHCLNTDTGTEYVGTVAMSASGKTCQRWDEQVPHTHDYLDMPEGSENYCRNPDNHEGGPWCYTIDPSERWEVCDIPQCKDCLFDQVGRDFSGSKSTTASGLECQRWDVDIPHPGSYKDPDLFPDGTLEAANNFCRNPDGRAGGPWCYTMDPDTEWESCGLPTCRDSERRHAIRNQPRAKHVLHIGVDGLDPCFTEKNMPNLDRLKEGAYTNDGARSNINTVSAPNWTGHMASTSVEVSGVTYNGHRPVFKGGDPAITPSTGRQHPFITITEYLKSQDDNIRTANIQDWDWLVYLGHLGVPGGSHYEYYCDGAADGQNYRQCDVEITAETVNYLKNVLVSAEKSYTFVYLAELDVVGHSSRWCQPQYMTYLDVIDEQVGQMLDAVDEVGAENDTLVILTTDHGGSQFSHGWNDDRDLAIPMFLRGPGVKKNYQLRFQPSNVDVGPTAAWALGVRPSPVWSGRVMTEAFEN